MIYKCEYCDVKGLVLVKALDHQLVNDREGVLEGLKVELVEQSNVFSRP